MYYEAPGSILIISMGAYGYGELVNIAQGHIVLMRKTPRNKI